MTELSELAPTERLVARLAEALRGTTSAALALGGLRSHLFVGGPNAHQLTFDCTRRLPHVEVGHRPPAHVVAQVSDERVLAALMAAYSMRELVPLFQKGAIRLVQGALFTMICTIRDRHNPGVNASLQAELESIVEHSEPVRGVSLGARTPAAAMDRRGAAR